MFPLIISLSAVQSISDIFDLLLSVQVNSAPLPLFFCEVSFNSGGTQPRNASIWLVQWASDPVINQRLSLCGLSRYLHRLLRRWESARDREGNSDHHKLQHQETEKFLLKLKNPETVPLDSIKIYGDSSVYHLTRRVGVVRQTKPRRGGQHDAPSLSCAARRLAYTRSVKQT